MSDTLMARAREALALAVQRAKWREDVAECDVYKDGLEAFDALSRELEQAGAEIALAMGHLREFNHVEGEPLSEVAAVAESTFGFLRHRAEVAEEREAQAVEALTGEGIDYTPEMLRALASSLPHDACNYILGCADALARLREGTGQKITHGRHCTCSACAREDWTRITVPCGMHGTGCPAVYAPLGGAGTYVLREGTEGDA